MGVPCARLIFSCRLLLTSQNPSLLKDITLLVILVHSPNHCLFQETVSESPIERKLLTAPSVCSTLAFQNVPRIWYPKTSQSSLYTFISSPNRTLAKPMVWCFVLSPGEGIIIPIILPIACPTCAKNLVMPKISR